MNVVGSTASRAFNPKKSNLNVVGSTASHSIPRRVKSDSIVLIGWEGHQLDAEGINFSAEQLSEVAEFPTPVGAKGLRSFLGLANYFCDHVRHYANMERPMRDVLTKHDKSKKFQWSELAERGFREMQVTIRDCAKLSFLKDEPEAQIILRTDASIMSGGWGA